MTIRGTSSYRYYIHGTVGKVVHNEYGDGVVRRIVQESPCKVVFLSDNESKGRIVNESDLFHISNPPISNFY